MDNTSFKSVMSKYYFTALDNYDCDNPVLLKLYVLNATVLEVFLVQ